MNIKIFRKAESRFTEKKQTLFFLGLLVLVLLLPNFSQAAGLVPCGGDAEAFCTVEDVFILIARTTNWLLSIAGIYAAYKIAGAGFWLVVTSGNEEKITQQKSALSNAVVGFVLAMMGYLFVNTVVNYIFLRGYGNNPAYSQCKVDLASPLTYVTVDYDKLYLCKNALRAEKEQAPQ
jgi:hypothetical protein